MLIDDTTTVFSLVAAAVSVAGWFFVQGRVASPSFNSPLSSGLGTDRLPRGFPGGVEYSCSIIHTGDNTVVVLSTPARGSYQVFELQLLQSYPYSCSRTVVLLFQERKKNKPVRPLMA